MWIIGRTQVNSKQDGIDVVIPLQQKYKLSPLSTFGKDYTPPSGKDEPVKGSPNEIVAAMPVEEYFNYVNQLLAKNPPPTADEAALKTFASIGIGRGAKFSLPSFNADVQTRLKTIPSEVLGDMQKRMINREKG